MTDNPGPGRQLRTLVRPDGVLELSLETVPTPEPADHEVVVRVDAAPINPSDMGLLFGGADMSQATASGTADAPAVTVKLSPAIAQANAARVGQSLAAGNEGAGVVVHAGSSPSAQALIGKTVGISGGSMYSQYRVLPAAQCLAMKIGTTAREAADCYVNPLTVLGMVETMRLEGHTALVHTAAASNLGQMLNRLCLQDGIGLVNIVRRQEHVDLLKSQGAAHVCNSSSPTFMDELTDAVDATGATLGFDAIGGGRIAGQILTAMEAAALRKATEFTRYGSNVYKQVYIYGGLDRAPTEFVRNFGLSWGLSGWLLTPFLARIGADATQKLRQRVADEITTTFASKYAGELSLNDALKLENIAIYGKQATGEKYLITPNSG